MVVSVPTHSKLFVSDKVEEAAAFDRFSRPRLASCVVSKRLICAKGAKAANTKISHAAKEVKQPKRKYKAQTHTNPYTYTHKE